MHERKKIVLILSRFPYPLDKGDKLRAYHQILYISKFHDVYLHALSDEKVNESHIKILEPLCKEIHIYPLYKLEILLQTLLSYLHHLPVQVGYFYSSIQHKKMTKAIVNLNPDIVYCQLSRTALYGRNLPFRKIMDFQDAFSTNYDRIQKNYHGFIKWFYKRESRCMKLFEQKILTWFDETTIISSFDKSKIETDQNRIVVISNGVDTQYFKARSNPKKVDILFTGNLSYLPNKNAVQYLLEKIAPKVVAIKPNLKIEIVGSSGEELKKYETTNIHIRGWLDDVRQAYDSASIFVVPLFTGAGLQNKLLEAMSMGVPCITTSITNKSLLAVPNVHLLIAENENEFVQKIIELLDNVELQKSLSKNARQFVEENFSWDKSNQKLLDLFAKKSYP